MGEQLSASESSEPHDGAARSGGEHGGADAARASSETSHARDSLRPGGVPSGSSAAASSCVRAGVWRVRGSAVSVAQAADAVAVELGCVHCTRERNTAGVQRRRVLGIGRHVLLQGRADAAWAAELHSFGCRAGTPAELGPGARADAR